MTKKPRPVGRPVEHTMPERIPDTPENIMKALANSPPKKPDEWRYLADSKPRGTAKPHAAHRYS